MLPKQHSINQSITSLWCDLRLDHILEVLPDCLLDDLFHQGLGLLHWDQKGLTQVLVELQGPPLHMPLLTPLIDGCLAEAEPHSVIIVDLQESNRFQLWVNKDQIKLYLGFREIKLLNIINIYELSGIILWIIKNPSVLYHRSTEIK